MTYERPSEPEMAFEGMKRYVNRMLVPSALVDLDRRRTIENIQFPRNHFRLVPIITASSRSIHSTTEAVISGVGRFSTPSAVKCIDLRPRLLSQSTPPLFLNNFISDRGSYLTCAGLTRTMKWTSTCSSPVRKELRVLELRNVNNNSEICMRVIALTCAGTNLGMIKPGLRPNSCRSKCQVACVNALSAVS
jgi:hypothetical protein